MSTITWNEPRFGHARAPRDVEAASRAHPPIRLTRRGRVLLSALAVLLLAAVLTALGLGGTGAEAGLDAGAAVPVITVAPGESLWSIAERIAPSADPRDIIEAIVSYNGLGGVDVWAGQRLGVPAQLFD